MPPTVVHARPKQTVTREIAINLYDKSDPPLVPAPAPACTVAEDTATTRTAGESFVQRAIACLLMLIFLSLVALIGVVIYFVVEIKPLVTIARDLHTNVEPAVGALTQLQPAVAALTSLTAGVNVTSMVGGSLSDIVGDSLSGMFKDGLAELPETVSLAFSQVVRDFGPPQSIPNLITHALSTHYGNLTTALLRIGRNLEPKLVHLHYYDWGLASFARSLSQMFQAIEYLDGPIHEAEAAVFGELQPPLNSDGDIAATLTHWLGKAPVEYVLLQLDQDAWNHTTASCIALREMLSTIMTKMSIVHPHLDMHNPIWISGSRDEHGVYQPGFYTMMMPPPPSPHPPSPPSPPPSPLYPPRCETSWCPISRIQSFQLEYMCRYNALHCGGCDACITYLETHPESGHSSPPPPRGWSSSHYSSSRYSYDEDMSGPGDGATEPETRLERGLRSVYTSLAPVCDMFSVLA